MKRVTAVALVILTMVATGLAQAPGTPEVKILKQFDKNDDGWLNVEERKPARQHVLSGAAGNRGLRGGRGSIGVVAAARPGATVDPSTVKAYPNAPFYDEDTLRTFFFTFENPDWEKELEDFHGTDVDVPATLTIDGKTYSDVGVRFRGLSSYMFIATGHKRSLAVSVDMAHAGQNVGGYRSLNLLNSHEDPTLMRAVLFLHVAREYVPAARANFARIVINGENWGIYQNVEQFSKEFVKENFHEDSGGSRWKAAGPSAQSALTYLGESPASYQRQYELKSKDDPATWAALIDLCRKLNQTPPDQLEKTLEPILDIDGALRFLALDAGLVNNDGYWTRASDYSIYRDSKGKFHIFPHDVNETFWLGAGGPGRGGTSAAGSGPLLDPLVGLNDNAKPLRSKLLAVPALRERYLGFVREIAQKWLDWANIGPVVQRYKALIDEEAKADTRKHDTYDAFLAETTGVGRSLKTFVIDRRQFLTYQAP